MVRAYRPESAKAGPVCEEAKRKAVRERARGTPLRKVAKKYGLSKSSLQRLESKLKTDPNCRLRKRGGQPALTSHHEEDIVKSLIICAEWGYPLSTFDLRCFVKTFLDKNGISSSRFKNNLPGYDWAAGFLRRHEGALSKRLCQNIKRNRASVSPKNINGFFDEYEITSAGIPAHLKVNYDESAWADDSGRKKLIFKRGCKYPERVINQTKSSVSVMFAATASGVLLPPYVIYKATNLYDAWTVGGPPGCLFNRTKSGWMDATIFADWFKSVIIPYFRRFEGNKLLIGDNLSSHLSPEVVGLCEANEIKFTFLPANSTHFTQPLDVSLFRPMKGQWRQVLEASKTKKSAGNQAFEKQHFPRLLRATLEGMEHTLAKDIIAGFIKCGLDPVNRKKVLARLPQELQQETEDEQVTVNDSLTEYLKLMRYGDESVPPKGRKKKLNVPAGRSVTSADFQPAASRTVAEAEHSLSESEQEELGDLGELSDRDEWEQDKHKEMEEPETDLALSDGEQVELDDFGELPEADLALSDGEQDELDDFGELENAEQVKLGEPGDELDDVEVDQDDEQDESVEADEPGVDNWVLVRFCYGKRETRLIGRIISKLGGDCIGSFLRQSTKKSDIFVFPDVEDKRAFASQDVITTLKEPSVRRGRYSFEPILLN